MENQYLTEKSLNDTYIHQFQVKEKLFSRQGKFQHIEVLDTFAVGRLLTLDGLAMISEKDEFIYHETMVHPAVLSQPETKRALVIGGGDGGIVRELCRYQSIEHIDLVEIDAEVIEVSREYFPEVSCELPNERVHIHIEDGVQFLKNQREKYDLIIVDSTDPVGLAKELYSGNFFQLISDQLTDQGIYLSQTGTPLLDEFNIRDNYKRLRKVFPQVHTLTAPIMIYPGVMWTFGFASKKYSPCHIQEGKLEEYQSFKGQLKWHNPEWQRSSVTLSNMFTQAIH